MRSVAACVGILALAAGLACAARAGEHHHDALCASFDTFQEHLPALCPGSTAANCSECAVERLNCTEPQGFAFCVGVQPEYHECTHIVREMCGEEDVNCTACAQAGGCLARNADAICEARETCLSAAEDKEGDACKAAANASCISAFEALTCTQEEKLDSLKVSQVAMLAVASVLIVITIAFELLKDWIFETTKKEFTKIVEVLFAELTVLGFLGLVVFIIQKTDAMNTLSLMCVTNCFFLLF